MDRVARLEGFPSATQEQKQERLLTPPKRKTGWFGRAVTVMRQPLTDPSGDPPSLVLWGEEE